MKTYEVNWGLMRQGIEELLKDKVNQILDNGGPFTLASAFKGYREVQQLAIQKGVSTREYDTQIRKFEEEIAGMLK